MERRLITMGLDAEHVPQQAGDGSIVNLAQPINAYGEDWRIASHTLTVLPNGNAVVSFLLERLPLTP